VARDVTLKSLRPRILDKKAGTGRFCVSLRCATTSTPVTFSGWLRSTLVSKVRVSRFQSPKLISTTSTETEGLAAAKFWAAFATAASSAVGIVTAGVSLSIMLRAAAKAAPSATFWSCVRAVQIMPTSMASEPAAIKAASATTTVMVVVPECRLALR
jgi:hypothetical protein